jgi:hypothetical protein
MIKTLLGFWHIWACVLNLVYFILELYIMICVDIIPSFDLNINVIIDQNSFKNSTFDILS